MNKKKVDIFFSITFPKFNIGNNFDIITSDLEQSYGNCELIIKVKSVKI